MAHDHKETDFTKHRSGYLFPKVLHEESFFILPITIKVSLPPSVA